LRYAVSLFRTWILSPYFEKWCKVFWWYSELEYSSLPSRLQMFWKHNISQFFVCFTTILLVWLQLHSTWGVWCTWITGTYHLKPHGITPLMKPMSNILITLSKNSCKFLCVLDKVSCLGLSFSYDYSMNHFCDVTIIKNWTIYNQDCYKWKLYVERAKMFKDWSCST
jgi:hypothetical protein